MTSKQPISKLILIITATATLVTLPIFHPVKTNAQPSSDNYQLNDYSFGSLGTSQGIGGGSLELFGVGGQTLAGSQSSSNYTFGGGIGFAQQTQTPDKPNLTNPHRFYDRLQITLDPSSDQDGVVYSFAITDDNWNTTRYITSAGLLRSQQEASDFQSYQDWGSNQGFLVTTLNSNTTYKVKVQARLGGLSPSEFSQEAEATTDQPSLSFTVDGSVNMGIWREENNYSSTAISKLTTSTNAHQGYQVYAYATNPLKRQNGQEIIPNYVGTYNSPGSWLTEKGFGYTTNDPLVGGQLKWNANPCPADGGAPLCYAAFSQSAPGDVIVDHQEPLHHGPIQDQQFEITYKAVTSPDQLAGVYSTTIIYTIAPTF